MSLDRPAPLADPAFNRPIELQLQPFTPSPAPHAPAASADIDATLNQYDIAVTMKPVYEWGGFRYTNATDAIAAAKRGRK